MVMVVLVGVVAADGVPGGPGDAQDHESDGEADEGVGDVEAEGDDGGAGDDGEADGTAVRASPKLWIRSASSATLPLATKTIVWMIAAAARTASARLTARMPSRER